MAGTPRAGETPTLSSALVGRLRQSIMRGDLGPGTRLHLDRMRTAYGVSLSPLREALCRLESEGLVRIEDQRGYRVTPVSAENLAELVLLRVELEGMALRAAMAQGDAAWESHILAALHRLNACPRPEPAALAQQEAWETAHRAFHAELISAGQMPLLRQFCAMLHDQGDRYRRIFLRDHAPDRDVPAEHAAIAQAVIARKEARALRLLRDHIERTGRNILAAFA